MEDALVRGPVAEEADGDAPRAFDLRVKGEAGRKGNAAAGDAVRAVEADGGVHHHLASAASARVAGFAPEELSHGASGVRAAREEMAVAAVGRGHGVARFERGGHADGDGLLADAGVGRAHDAPLEK
jgi:hypothetical protein